MDDGKFTKEERFGLIFTSIINTVIIIITLLIYAGGPDLDRVAFIEITLGEFKDGTTAQFNEQRNQEVATRRNPSNITTPEPVERENPNETPVVRNDQLSKEVDLPDQVEMVEEEPVSTPETERIDPTKTTDVVSEEATPVEQRAQHDNVEREGAESSGDVRGVRGRVDADQGTGIDPVRSAPYDLKFDGNIQRFPEIQPLPVYNVEVEAVITMRFEVRPNGTVGNIQPVRRANPELEAEVTKTLRSWKFSSLPSNTPQESQFGVITFRFVLN